MNEDEILRAGIMKALDYYNDAYIDPTDCCELMGRALESAIDKLK